MKLKLLILLLITISALAGCTPKNNIEEDEALINSNELISTNKHYDETLRLKQSTELEGKIERNEYKLPTGSCFSNSLVAPAFGNEKSIIFLDSNENEYRIMEYVKTTNKCNMLYSTKGIGQVVGEANYIFWTEYDNTKYTEVEWNIKSLDLLSGEIRIIKSGESQKETPPPTLRTEEGSISWIEYKIDTDLVISSLVNYSIDKNKIEVIEMTELDEESIRQGDYLIAHESVPHDSYLIYKSLFDKGTKKFEISLLDEDKKESKLLNEDYILDFAINKRYFVYTGEGHLTAITRNKGKVIKFQTGNELTTDTPIFIGDSKLIFRYAMNDLFLVEMEEGTYHSILNDENLTISKPIYYNETLAFGEIDENSNVVFVEMKFH